MLAQFEGGSFKGESPYRPPKKIRQRKGQGRPPRRCLNVILLAVVLVEVAYWGCDVVWCDVVWCCAGVMGCDSVM